VWFSCIVCGKLNLHCRSEFSQLIVIFRKINCYVVITVGTVLCILLHMRDISDTELHQWSPWERMLISLLGQCWLGHLTCPAVLEMTYNVSSGTLSLYSLIHCCLTRRLHVIVVDMFLLFFLIIFRCIVFLPVCWMRDPILHGCWCCFVINIIVNYVVSPSFGAIRAATLLESTDSVSWLEWM